METPSDRILSLTLSWSAGSKKRVLGGPVGPLLRVAAVLALCALSYQFGVWRVRLEQQAAVAAAEPREILALPVDNPERVTGAAAGHALKEPDGDIITPLNVRDPSALVMGPGATEMPPPAATPPPPPRPLKGNWRDELKRN